jgi:dTDP-4-amino-4,6-dideoxygalactose transaminase
MTKLALLGGSPVLGRRLKPYNSVGQAEFAAVSKVFESGCLSGFYGSWGEEFLGGPLVRAFEEAWAARFQVRHAVSVNSATSGLFAAMGAIGLSPGDEVIVPPYTMSATAMAPLIYGGIPVFVDIEPDTFCLDPEQVRRAITPRTKAILAVNLFGHPARLTELKAIAEAHGLMLVEDNAQAPLARENGSYAGTVGDIGVFSLNYHKHIHTGEGGVCVTQDPDLALRLQLIRNHAENIAEPLEIQDLCNLVGFNYRLTEMSAAVGLAQLDQIEAHVGRRRILAERLTQGLQDLEGLTPPRVRPGCRHVYYVWAMKFEADKVGLSREQFSLALKAEGFPHFLGYVRPLYLLPLFQKRRAFGRGGYPFNLSQVKYEKGLCPVTERMHEQELLCFEVCQHDVSEAEVDLLLEAVHKVYRNRHELKSTA